MKKCLLLFGLFFSAQSFFAQSSTMVINPNPVVTNGIAASDFEGVGHAEAINNSNNTLQVRWTRKVISITEGWQSAICDKNQCFFPSVSSQPFEFLPNEAARLDVHVYPNDFVGAAVIEVTLVNTQDTTQSVTGVYFFNQVPNGTVDASFQAVKVYPNPTQGLFTISDADQVERVDIFDLAGRTVKQFQYGGGQWYSISDLPQGSYIVRLLGGTGQTLVTRLMNKE
ncbi:MAG: T9SS type A sorting domain-containing protein [Saprospiraceae bacterium]|nr:T9SS type A sorting domain-containing protein [Saprospiraceae bacterium]MDZ4706496.1 T9SS type A sorting domain-containing protein [Saprospiraceae bacterium]